MSSFIFAIILTILVVAITYVLGRYLKPPDEHTGNDPTLPRQRQPGSPNGRPAPAEAARLHPASASDQAPVIQLENISVCYRVPTKRIFSFKEYLIRRLQGQVGYRQFWALKSVDLEVRRGQVLGIIGPNGAGKSTLLKVVARVLRPTSGRIRVRGQVAPLLELGAGFDSELSGRENIFLYGSVLGFSRQDLEARLNRIIDFTGLAQFIDMPLRTYSTGMVIRLGFAVASDVQPDILIVDEVLSVGDEKFKRRSLERIETFRKNGATILFVSHSLPLIEAMCEHVIWLEQGQLRASGPTAEILQAYQDQASSKEI
jgi:ABC-2 type transport system ATP-binding protein